MYGKNKTKEEDEKCGKLEKTRHSEGLMSMSYFLHSSFCW
jgi:hypothetical protein